MKGPRAVTTNAVGMCRQGGRVSMAGGSWIVSGEFRERVRAAASAGGASSSVSGS